jgi:hypothetical protein
MDITPIQKLRNYSASCKVRAHWPDVHCRIHWKERMMSTAKHVLTRPLSIGYWGGGGSFIFLKLPDMKPALKYHATSLSS